MIKNLIKILEERKRELNKLLKRDIKKATKSQVKGAIAEIDHLIEILNDQRELEIQNESLSSNLLKAEYDETPFLNIFGRKAVTNGKNFHEKIGQELFH